MEYRRKEFITKWTCRILLLIWTLITLYPLFWNIMSSFRTNAEILANATALPTGFEWENYVRAFENANMGSYFINSVFVTVLALALHLILVIPFAQALARFKFRGSRTIEIILAACLFLNGAYLVIPIFQLFHNLGWTDNLWALALLYAGGSVPFSTFLLAGYMRTISKTYFEAAKIDGCSEWGILFKIVIPMSKPGIITISMLALMNYWNEFLMAFVLIRSPENRTLNLGLANLFEVQQRATDFGALYAALIIMLIPTIIIYLIGQKHLIGALNTGGIKE